MAAQRNGSEYRIGIAQVRLRFTLSPKVRLACVIRFVGAHRCSSLDRKCFEAGARQYLQIGQRKACVARCKKLRSTMGKMRAKRSRFGCPRCLRCNTFNQFLPKNIHLANRPRPTCRMNESGIMRTHNMPYTASCGLAIVSKMEPILSVRIGIRCVKACSRDVYDSSKTRICNLRPRTNDFCIKPQAKPLHAEEMYWECHGKRESQR